MDLERRVKMLEDEVKILKNQIQNTLLDIQDGLLAARLGETGRPSAIGAADPSPKGAREGAKAPAPRPTEESRASLGRRESARSAADELDFATMARLVKWLQSSAARVGAGATREALQAAHEAGQLSAAARDSLLALLPEGEEDVQVNMSEFLRIYRLLNGILQGEAEPVEVAAQAVRRG